MHSALAILAVVGAAVANPMPQAVTSAIAPSSSAPSGCETSYSGTFEIQIVNVTSSSKVKRQDTALECTLSDGVLKDAKGRTGYIAANNQFQFDGPPQAGAIYTAGWSVCANDSLALGDESVFYQCLSGTFYNLYDESTGAQCSEVYIDVIGSGSSGVASVTSDGQVTASAVASQETDGQITATPVSSAVCEYTDGQPQVTGCVTQISDGQIQASSAAPVSQISDGQIQATTAASAAPVSQISDGQIQATTATPVVSQISDGQIQATTATAVVSQISDGQIQATTAVVSQISDGQPQAPTNGSSVASATATVQPFTGGAAIATGLPAVLAAGAVLVAALL